MNNLQVQSVGRSSGSAVGSRTSHFSLFDVSATSRDEVPFKRHPSKFQSFNYRWLHDLPEVSWEDSSRVREEFTS